MDSEALKGSLRRVAEEVEAEIRQVEKELAETDRRARRVGAKRRVEELSTIRDILYEDMRLTRGGSVAVCLTRPMPRSPQRPQPRCGATPADVQRC